MRAAGILEAQESQGRDSSQGDRCQQRALNDHRPGHAGKDVTRDDLPVGKTSSTLAASTNNSLPAQTVADRTTRVAGADRMIPRGTTAGVRLPAKIDSTTTRTTISGSAQQDIDPCAEQTVNAAAPETSYDADGNADDYGEHHHLEGRQENRPAAVQQTAQHVPAQFVGTQRWPTDGPDSTLSKLVARGLNGAIQLARAHASDKASR